MRLEEILTGLFQQPHHRLGHVVIGATDLGARRQPESVSHAGERHVPVLEHTSDPRSPATVGDRDCRRVALDGSIGARTAAVRASFRSADACGEDDRVGVKPASCRLRSDHATVPQQQPGDRLSFQDGRSACT